MELKIANGDIGEAQRDPWHTASAMVVVMEFQFKHMEFTIKV